MKITTESGLVGYDDATFNGRELAVKAAIDRHISRQIIGRDSGNITDIWELLFRGTYWRGGPVLMTALAGIDMALWDIKGKKYGAPLYDLFGGRSCDRLRAYFHVHGRTKEELLERIRTRREGGCTCMRYSFDTADPSGGSRLFTQPHQDFAAAGKRIEVREEGIHKPGEWDEAAYRRDLLRVTDYLRRELGDSVDLIHDMHERLSPILAADTARQLEPYGLFFLEDPIEPMDPGALSIIRNSTTVPLPMEELYHTVRDCRQPLENRWFDYLRVDISHFGGITPLRNVSLLADTYSVRTAFHGPSDISPLAHAALVHIDFSLPNFGIQEHVDKSATVDKVFKNRLLL